jgi:hypothetical protein
MSPMRHLDRETSMNCLYCAKEIRVETSTDGRFTCPHCSADHARREIGRLASGQPEYTIRLWGHLTRFRRAAKG